MEDKSKTEAEINKQVEEIHKETQPALYEFNPASKELYIQTEKEMNQKILDITMKIKDQYPELSKYLEEMPVTIPDEKNPEIALENLKAYYNSLDSLVSKYILEQSVKEKQD